MEFWGYDLIVETSVETFMAGHRVSDEAGDEKHTVDRMQIISCANIDKKCRQWHEKLLR